MSRPTLLSYWSIAVLTAAVVAWGPIGAPPVLARTWTSASGNHKTDAEFVDLTDDGLVVLKTSEGKTIEVPLSKLSDGDQEFARKRESAKPRAASDSGKKSPEQVEAEAQQCRTAKEATVLYKFYLLRKDLTATERAAAEAKQAEWKKKADGDQVRLGRQWMPKSEADKLRKQAQAKIEHAVELLRLRNEELAEQSLEEASKLDPESIQAEFLLGVVYGAISRNDKKAQIHFEKCLKREPGNVSVLNNLAVSLANQKKYPDAARYWKTAAANAPKMRELSQNIGSLITLVGTKQAKLPPKTLQDLSELYEEMVTKHGSPRPSQIAFVYAPPYGSKLPGERGGSDRGPSGESVVLSSGSGFVVSPHVILTNRHVVEHASGLLVVNPKNPSGEPLAAELIAISDKVDLALVRCEALDAPAVPLAESLPPRGSDIMVLGYPLGPEFGKSLKSTRGSMVAMPDASVDNMCLYDAVTNPGNSGGPLCDKKARVAAVVRAVTGSVGGSYGAAIPIASAMPFLRSHLPDLAAVATDEQEFDWPGVDAKIAPSTVLILKKEERRTDIGVGGRR